MNAGKLARVASARFMALFLGATLPGSFSVAAVAIPPGGLAAARSGDDLNLSFATASPNFYVLQTSPDLQHWTDDQGIPGDGTTKTLTVTNVVSGGQGFYRLLIQAPKQLLLPQASAFAILGYSCGGIKETVSAGFDVTNGLPTGVVNLSTTCSGGGRGTHPVTHTASALVVWDLGGNVISATMITNGITTGPTTDGLGNVIYEVGSAAYLVVPVPSAPTDVTVVQFDDEFQVSWTPNAAVPATITSSTLTATPINPPASPLITIVTGPATSGIIPTLQPATTYQVTVVNTTVGGTSATSTPITVTTSAATIKPSAPTGVTAHWSNLDPTGPTDTIIASWQASSPGNSPVDQYLVTINGSEGAGTLTQTVSGTTFTTSFIVDYIPNWSVTVQAHNAAGWGPVSAAFNLGGL